MRADRLIKLMLLLNARGRLTAQRLADELEVTERTIYRDVQALGAAGIPVNAGPGPAGGIWLDEQYHVSLTGLSRDQVRSLFLANAARPLNDLGLAQTLEDSLLRLFAALPLRYRDDVTRLRQRFYIDTTGWFEGGEAIPFFSRLQQAVWEDRQIDETYQPDESVVSTGRLDPYGLAAKAAIWYLVGRKSDGAFYTYRVSRFRRVRLTDTPFERDPAFDLARYWRTAAEAFERQAAVRTGPYPAVVRIHPSALWRASALAHGPYERIGRPQSSGWVRLRMTFSSADEACWMILSLGTEARVLKPKALARAVADAGRAIANQYEQQNFASTKPQDKQRA